MSPRDSQRAYLSWFTHYEHQLADQAVEPFLNENIGVYKGPWLKITRNALFVSSGEMAKRLKIARSGYIQLEQSEGRGTIRLKTLKKIAEALDCELIYALRPKSKQRFSEVIWAALKSQALEHPFVANKKEPWLKGRALLAITRLKMHNSEFRREKSWSERRGKKNMLFQR